MLGLGYMVLNGINNSELIHVFLVSAFAQRHSPLFSPHLCSCFRSPSRRANFSNSGDASRSNNTSMNAERRRSAIVFVRERNRIKEKVCKLRNTSVLGLYCFREREKKEASM
ncbi:hypothetical protein I3760_16G092600 [Carya illinoinensis]|nr:hypothetical protein I3760_16G092600 [Carya illinoinensis]